MLGNLPLPYPCCLFPALQVKDAAQREGVCAAHDKEKEEQDEVAVVCPADAVV